MKQILAHIIILISFAYTLQGQTAMDTINLPEVKLEQSRLRTHSIATQMEIFTPVELGNFPSQNLADFLSLNSALYFRQYGALATPSFRGTSSSHTLVLWNGIPLNSVANGLMDFSILPVNIGHELAVVHGGDGSVFGSGAIGGSVHFNAISNFKPKKQIQFTSEIGSFGLRSNTFSLKRTEGKLSIQASLFSLSDNNSFEFVNTTQIGHPSVMNEYGKIESKHQQLDLGYRYDNYNQFAINYWAEDNNREVPQNMTVLFSDAKQYDVSKRLLFSSKHRFDHSSLQLKQAYLKEDFRYTELLWGIDSHYLTESHITDADFKYFTGNYLFNLGSAYTNKSVTNTNYLGTKQDEKQLALFSAIQYKSEFFVVNTILRKEWQSAFEVPYIPTLGFSAQLSKHLQFRLKYNRNFRSPSFNDRFWVDAWSNGNPDLKPENAWNKEFGFDVNTSYFTCSATAYTLTISDMILWQEMDNGNWMPDNIKQVWSRGVETKLKLTIKDFSIVGNYGFTKSTNELSSDSLDNTAGKQLRYVPLHKGNVMFIIAKDDFQFSINQSYTGEVITTHGIQENETLPAFVLTDIGLRWKSTHSSFSLQGKVKNLMDKSYQTYQNYPNPGRELQLTITYSIN
ncbi:MAG TPA: TonB-dependent receptor [Flavobacteriales bacterium]|nr:TonB-dependent receptor [Flavobacteriales bacterium]